jgi:hypothetical protein
MLSSSLSCLPLFLFILPVLFLSLYVSSFSFPLCNAGAVVMENGSGCWDEEDDELMMVLAVLVRL